MAARSPNYPNSSLPVAIELARVLWEKQQTNAATPEEISQYMGYKGLNGKSRSKLAVLKSYGLLDASSGGWKLTGRAIVIMNSDSGDPKILKAIQDAFSEVTLFRTLLEKFPDASKGLITTYLMSEMGFTKEGATAAVDSFLESKALVGSSISPTLEAAKDSDIDPAPAAQPQLKQSTQAVATPLKPLGVSMEEFKIPCSNGSSVVLHYPTTMTQADYELVDMFLKAFWTSKKPVLIKNEKADEQPASQN